MCSNLGAGPLHSRYSYLQNVNALTDETQNIQSIQWDMLSQTGNQTGLKVSSWSVSTTWWLKANIDPYGYFVLGLYVIIAVSFWFYPGQCFSGEVPNHHWLFYIIGSSLPSSLVACTVSPWNDIDASTWTILYSLSNTLPVLSPVSPSLHPQIHCNTIIFTLESGTKGTPTLNDDLA